jgi:hypothetical protein
MKLLFHSTFQAPAAGPAAKELRAPCDTLVDAVFVLDDVTNVWLIRESIRHYETQLLASPNARFGVVLCGSMQAFHTYFHRHFSSQSMLGI